MSHLILILVFISAQVYAGTITVNSPCDDQELVFETHIQGDSSVGDVTIKAFTQHGLEFIGTAAGMSSIFGTPVGSDAIDIVSDTEMFAYGWCYTVNGVGPEEYPDQVFIGDEDHVLWYFGSAHYKDGHWLTQCEPSSSRRFASYCDLDSNGIL